MGLQYKKVLCLSFKAERGFVLIDAIHCKQTIKKYPIS